MIVNHTRLKGQCIEPSCQRNYIIGKNKFSYIAPSCEIITFNNVKQISGSGIQCYAGVIKDNTFYYEGFTKKALASQGPSPFWNKLKDNFQINLSGKRIYQANEIFTWYNIREYWHWFLEDLPLIKAFRTKPNLPIYVNKLNHYQKESLEYFKDIKERIVEIEVPSIIEAKKLHVVTYPAISNRGKAATWSSHFLRENLKGVESYFSPKRVYISRDDAIARRVVNENDVIKLLHKHSFTIIDDTTSMSLQEKLNLFYNADILVSPTGANLTHVHAMKKGSIIIDFNHSFEVSEECGWNNIGAACGIKWITIPAKTIGQPPSSRPKMKNAHLKVDINNLERVISERLGI